jgi:hypothetical protein
MSPSVCPIALLPKWEVFLSPTDQFEKALEPATPGTHSFSRETPPSEAFSLS